MKAVGEQVGKEKRPAVQEPAAQELDAIIGGRITKVQFPDVKGPINPIYKNTLFLDSIKEFQTDVVLKESNQIEYSTKTMDYEKNDIKYKLLMKPIKEKRWIGNLYICDGFFTACR